MIKNNLKNIMKAKGIGPKRLSDLMGLGDPSRIHHIQHADDVLLSTAYKLAKSLNCKIEDIFEVME